MLEINTEGEGACLLCLRTSGSVSNNGNGNETQGQKPDMAKTALKMLLRYLKVDLTKILPDSSPNGKMVVSLCNGCYLEATDFLELFQTFESIRILLEMNVQRLHKFMEKADKDEEPGRQVMANVVEMLRQEIMVKASRKIASSWPRVSLSVKRTMEKNLTGLQYSFEGSGTLPNEGVIQEEEEQLQPDGNDANTGNSSASSSVAGHAEIVGVDAEDSLSEPGPMNLVQLKETTRRSKRKHAEGRQYEITAEGDGKTGTSCQKIQKGSKYVCVYCASIFGNSPNLGTHLLSKHANQYLSDRGLLPSRISEKELEKVLKLILRKSSTSGQPHQCPKCSMSFQWKCSLRLHFLRKHLDCVIKSSGNIPRKDGKGWIFRKKMARFKCATCKLFFTTRPNLQGHRLRVHAAVTNHPCLLDSGISEEQMNNVLKVVADIIRRMKSQVTKCPFCKEVNEFSRKCALKAHLLGEHAHQIVENIQGKSSHHPISDREPHPQINGVGRNNQGKPKTRKCDECGKRFATKAFVVKHKYHAHPMVWLKGHVPPTVTEEMLTKVIEKITQMANVQLARRSKYVRLRLRVFHCPLCKKKVFHTLKPHLLQYHLDHVAETIKENLELEEC